MIKIKNHEKEQVENYVKSIRIEWKKFINEGKANAHIIRPLILESWIRSKKWGVDPNGNEKSHIDNIDLFNRLEKNQDLIKIASPLLEILNNSVKGSGFRIDLFDKDVFILKQWGDIETLENSLKYGSSPGICKSEQIAGTNAIGLAKFLKKPVQLVGPEHYNIKLHKWTCSAAPIKNSYGDIVGIINMSGDYKLIHKHTIGMVIATVRAIKNQIQENDISKKLETENEYLLATIESSFDALLIINEKGVIVRINKIGEEILGLPAEAVLQQKCEDIFGTSNPFTQVLFTKKVIKEEEVMFNINGREKIFFSTIKPILNEFRNRTKGVTAYFREVKYIKKIAKIYSAPRARFHFKDLIGEDKKFIKAINMAKKIANSNVKVLLEGETGTGKELFAHAIHNFSSRRNKPFIAINCAAIPLELVESELFGYEEGAFTGAKRGGLLGRIELADGGTLFLDEISSMPLSVQSKFLRVLETGIITRIGARKEIFVDIRIISASNKNLWEEMKNNNFREDLFYRINLMTIKIPPLRERKNDIPLLIKYFNKRKFYNDQTDIFLLIENKALQILQSYHWPGNIRELENMIERAFLLSSSSKIKVKDLSPELIQIVSNGFNFSLDNGETKKIKEVERELMIKELKLVDNNITLAAKNLGITRSTFYLKMKKYEINKNIL